MNIRVDSRVARFGLAGLTSSVLFLIPILSGASSAAPLSPVFSGTSQTAKSTAKSDYALIFGTVWGPDARPVSGVPIKIRRASDKKAKWELFSDHNGEFAQRVPVGAQDYLIEADIKVAKGQQKPATTVHIENNERKDVGLHLTEQQLSHR